MPLPWVDRVVALLKNNAYFFGGIFQQWFGEDGLFMQKILSQPNWEDIHLFSERAKKILQFVKADWQRKKGIKVINTPDEINEEVRRENTRVCNLCKYNKA